MRLGGYLFPWNPENFTPPVPEKMMSSVKTYASVAVFSWGASITGKEIVLKWDLMGNAQFDALQALFEADAIVLWDLDVLGQMNYYVAIKKFDGEFLDVIYDNGYKTKVELTLLILEESSIGMS